MRTEATYLFGAIVVGVGATLFMDLWALFVERTLRIPSPNYCLVGRWFSHMPEGKFKHASIAAATQKQSECTVGWIAHYVIGAAYALTLVVLMSGRWLAQPTLLPARSLASAPWWSLFSSCSPRSDSVLLRPERRIQRRPGLEVSWRIPPSASDYMYAPLA